NAIVIPIALSWTLCCGLIGIVMILLIWDGRKVQYINARYLWSPLVCFVCGIHVKVSGIENIDKNNAAIYIANHSSYLDILALSRVMPTGLFYVGKKELGWIPVLGLYIWVVGHFFVDRKNHSAAMNSMRRAAKKILNGRSIIVFAEGTRSSDGQVGKFKRGAFIIAKEGMIDIMPIAVIGAHDLLPKKSIMLKSGIVEVKFGPRISSREIQKYSETEIADFTRKKVIELMNPNE
ncbi:MAG: lysophospholipid acyltransferase family protein, partial [Flavobacteriales bacterium]